MPQPIARHWAKFWTRWDGEIVEKKKDSVLAEDVFDELKNAYRLNLKYTKDCRSMIRLAQLMVRVGGTIGMTPDTVMNEVDIMIQEAIAADKASRLN